MITNVFAPLPRHADSCWSPSWPGDKVANCCVKWLSGWLSWVGSSRCSSCLTLGTKPSSWSNVQIKLPFHDTITHVLHVHVLRFLFFHFFYFVAAWDAHPFLISSNSMICSSISSSFSLVSSSKWTKSYIIPQMSRPGWKHRKPKKWYPDWMWVKKNMSK